MIKEAIAAEQEDDATKKSAVTVRLRRAEKSDENLSVDMTSTGLNKSKRHEAEEKRRRFQRTRYLRVKNKTTTENKDEDKE